MEKGVQSEGAKHPNTQARCCPSGRISSYSSVNDVQGNYETTIQAFPLPRVNNSLKRSIHKGLLLLFSKRE